MVPAVQSGMLRIVEEKPSAPKLVDLLRHVGEEFFEKHHLSKNVVDSLRRMSKCGTGEYGYDLHGCRSCEGVFWKGLGCRNRNCPHCGIKRWEDWRLSREKELLPIPYDQVVVPMPALLQYRAWEHPDVILKLHMDSSSAAIIDVAVETYGGVPSLLQVLHTHGHGMEYHVHTHHLVGRGGFDKDEYKLVGVDHHGECPLDKAALHASYLKHLVRGLKNARRKGLLTFDWQKNVYLNDDSAWQRHLDAVAESKLSLYTAPCRGGARQTLAYFANTMREGALAHIQFHRLDGDILAYSVLSSKGQRVHKRLHVEKFLLQFIRHILPKGFNRVRYKGMLAPACRDWLNEARARFDWLYDKTGIIPFEHPDPTLQLPKMETPCPHCKSIDTVWIRRFRRELTKLLRITSAEIPDPDITDLHYFLFEQYLDRESKSEMKSAA